MHRRESWARGSKTNGGATSLVMELCDGGIGAQVKSDASTSIGRAQSGGAREDPWWFAAHLYGDTREGDGDGWSQLGNLSVGGNTEELRK